METNLHDYMCVPILSFEHFVNLSSNLSLFKELRDHILCRSKQPHYHSHIAKLSVKVIMQIIRQKKGRSKRRKKYTDKDFDINDRLFLVALIMYSVAY